VSSLEWCIAACGEGLDSAKWDTLPTTRIAVNEATHRMPDYQYFSAIDRIEYADYPGARDAIRLITTLAIRMYDREGKPYDLGDVYHAIDYDAALGSLDLAVMYALRQGATRVVLVGADGMGTKARGMTAPIHRSTYPHWCARVIKQCEKICRDADCQLILL